MLPLSTFGGSAPKISLYVPEYPIQGRNLLIINLEEKFVIKQLMNTKQGTGRKKPDTQFETQVISKRLSSVEE